MKRKNYAWVLALVILNLIRLNAFGQDDYKTLSILPFTGINVEGETLKEAENAFLKEFQQSLRFQYIAFSDFQAMLKDSGLEKLNVLDDTYIVNLGDYLNIDYLIAGIVGKAQNKYSVEIKLIDVRAVDIPYSKKIDGESMEAINQSLMQIADELEKDKTFW